MLDAFAGLYCVNVGYGQTEIADAAGVSSDLRVITPACHDTASAIAAARRIRPL